METTGEPGKIHISEATYQLLQEGDDVWEARGQGTEVKGGWASGCRRAGRVHSPVGCRRKAFVRAHA
jgi:hypothetical protein